MIGRTNTGGGVPSLPQYAAISVTYGTGLVCTCSDGITTLTAPDTSGSVLFIVPYAATWTVTDGNASESVAISEYAEVIDVNITESVVFAYGDTTLADFRTLWRYIDSQANTTISTSANKYYTFAPPGSNLRGWQFKTALDLTNYSTLRLYGYRSGTAVVGFNASNTSTSANCVNSGQLDPGTTYGIYESDISSLTGNYYFGVRGQPSSTMYIEKVVLV